MGSCKRVYNAWKSKLHSYCDIQCPYCKKNSDKILRAASAGFVRKYYECPFCKAKVKIHPRYRILKTSLFLVMYALLWVPSQIAADWVWPLMGGDLDTYSQGHSALFAIILSLCWYAICVFIHAALGRKLPWAAEITTAEQDEPQGNEPN